MQEYIMIGVIVYVVAGVGTAVTIPLKIGWGSFFLTIIVWPVRIKQWLYKNFGPEDPGW